MAPAQSYESSVVADPESAVQYPHCGPQRQISGGHPFSATWLLVPLAPAMTLGMEDLEAYMGAAGLVQQLGDLRDSMRACDV